MSDPWDESNQADPNPWNNSHEAELALARACVNAERLHLQALIDMAMARLDEAVAAPWSETRYARIEQARDRLAELLLAFAQHRR